ncbi:hypothetical protein [Paenibacillus lutrae]|uniref:Uncharacterized protein n=1 Tax=Paenibacillus lutrae TaxID=2078573 RepID=A0A7X3FM04_9BACL|nr:hypothetical protein [Paenibacillus lutrae]MVP02073.1 hypothetical protein [Paenibacillus lutrae]
MSEAVNEQELVDYIALKTNAAPAAIRLVLQHEQVFLNNAKANAKGEVDIDSDDIVDYVLSRRDVKLDELTVESILDTEMDFLMDKGIAGYVD